MKIVNEQSAIHIDFAALSDKQGKDGDALLLERLGRVCRSSAFDGDVEATSVGALSTENMQRLGAVVFRRLEMSLFRLLCGNEPDDITDREAIGLVESTLIGVLTTALVTGLSVTPAAAALVAALILRRIAQPTLDGVCEVWFERFETTKSQGLLPERCSEKTQP